MRKLKILSGKDVCKILSAHGFIQVRQKGSHIVMQKKTDNTPNHPEIRIGTLQSIIRQSEIPREYFENN